MPRLPRPPVVRALSPRHQAAKRNETGSETTNEFVGVSGRKKQRGSMSTTRKNHLKKKTATFSVTSLEQAAAVASSSASPGRTASEGEKVLPALDEHPCPYASLTKT